MDNSINSIMKQFPWQTGVFCNIFQNRTWWFRCAKSAIYIYVFYESPYTETHFENLSVHCVVILLTCTRTVSMWRLQKFWHQMHSKPSATISNGMCYAHSLTCSDRWHFSNQLLHSSKAWLFRNHASLWHTFQLTKHFEILHSPRQWYFHVL